MTLQERSIAPALPDTAALKARFAPLFARIREGATHRERERILPFEEITWLKEAGFTALRVPVEYGGAGASLEQLFDLLIDLAAADTNIVQALRGHFALVEDRLVAPKAQGEAWLKRFGAGETAGNAWSEVGNVKLGETLTKVTPEGDGFRVDGEKYYSTGTIFADWIDTYAVRSDNGAPVVAILRADQPGITRADDWKGFGQKLTGTGTTTFKDAKLGADALVPFETRFRYQTAFYQLVLNAVLSGAALAAVQDVAEKVSQRKRAYSHGSGTVVARDPQILQVVGRARAFAFAARAATLEAARAADRAHETALAGDKAADDAANIAAELASAEAQVAAADLALRATSDLFNALGASATDTALALDRYWRNARVAASHNPLIYKERILGDHAVNGTEPVFIWQIGAVES
ncbi:monooxygenase [Xinfangfangia sp. D13-10-4-6]|uniref:acyl-CoA dehydrogenase family protein n=1 Tax=Pseudogemmobacter hezensis TaxID=2737662 RepID=UPI0015528125|nr:acyl-CoA dehydrogenase family protein [Pseudogemmobacter hezensis]NPD14793.1 monooxygenase [Pseudogemmobacter hezensis]